MSVLELDPPPAPRRSPRLEPVLELELEQLPPRSLRDWFNLVAYRVTVGVLLVLCAFVLGLFVGQTAQAFGWVVRL